MSTGKSINTFLLGEMHPYTLKSWMDNIQINAVGSAILWGSYKLGKPEENHPIVSRILLCISLIIFILAFAQALFMVSEYFVDIKLNEPSGTIFRKAYKLLTFGIFIILQMGLFIVYGSIYIGIARP